MGTHHCLTNQNRIQDVGDQEIEQIRLMRWHVYLHSEEFPGMLGHTRSELVIQSEHPGPHATLKCLHRRVALSEPKLEKSFSAMREEPLDLLPPLQRAQLPHESQMPCICRSTWGQSFRYDSILMPLVFLQGRRKAL